MTEEEMRAKIIELDDKVKTLETEKTAIETEKTELETKYQTDLQMSEKRIDDLKDYNRELFMKVTTKVEPKPEEQKPDNNYSLDDLLSDFNK